MYIFRICPHPLKSLQQYFRQSQCASASAGASVQDYEVENLISAWGLITNYVSQKCGGPDPLPPLSVIVSISPTPLPPFVSQYHHFPNPHSPLRQLCQDLPNRPFLFGVSFVKIFNDPLILNNIFVLEESTLFAKFINMS